MRKALFILLLLFLISCDKECHEDMGTIISKEIPVSEFNSIISNEGILLIIEEANTTKVIVETGENRMDNVSVTVTDNILELKADSACSLMPSLEPIKVYVSTPTLQKLRNSSEYEIQCLGILHFPNLTILSENYQSDYTNFGGFDLQVDNDAIQIVSNGLAMIKIAGSTSSLILSYYAGIGKFEGKDLIAQNVTIYHKGENKLEVNPQLSLIGNLYSTGDLISYKHPETVDITEHFKGKLIYR